MSIARDRRRCDDRVVRRTRTVVLVWTMFAVVLAAIVVTYSRLPPHELYNVVGHGFVGGGLSRAVVYVNFPLGLAAMLLLLAVADRMSRGQRYAAVAAFVLWAPVFSPRVLSTAYLDARWANAVPAAAVALALVVTLTTPAVRPAHVRGDAARAAVALCLLAIALPWIAAELGLDFVHVPVLGQIFQTHELRVQPGMIVPHPAVHYGDHHGLEATLLVLTALLTSRMLGATRSPRLRRAFGFALALVIAYGLGNIANDFWIEQVAKRGWTTWLVPDVLQPKLSWAWLMIVAVAFVLWLALFRPRHPSRTTPDAASSAIRPSS